MGETDGKRMALARVSMCPGGVAWLEGLRVHPDFRRAKVATALLDKMIKLAARRGAKETSAIVSQENLPSQRMLEKMDFPRYQNGSIMAQKQNSKCALIGPARPQSKNLQEHGNTYANRVHTGCLQGAMSARGSGIRLTGRP